MGVGVRCGRVVVNGIRLCPKHLLWKMTPWTIRLVLDVPLVDEMLDVNHSMDHPMESQDALLPFQPQLGARLPATATE